MSFWRTLVHPARRSQANQDTYLVSSSNVIAKPLQHTLSARSCNTTMPSCRNHLGSQVVKCVWAMGNAWRAHAKPSLMTRCQQRSESLPGSALRLLGLGRGQSFCCYIFSVGLQNVSSNTAGAIAHSLFRPCSSCARPRQQTRQTCL